MTPAFTLIASASLAGIGFAAMVVGVRCADQTRQLGFQRLFTACLVGGGGMTIVTLAHQDASWICGAVAYAGLAIAATCDGRSREAYFTA